MKVISALVTASLLLLMSLVLAAPAEAVSPPGQPASGPGGAASPHAACSETWLPNLSNDKLTSWVFQPQSPAPANATVIVFNHGWGVFDPTGYGQWINHMCRKGNIVIFPKYQTSIFDSGWEVTDNAITATKNAIGWLNSYGQVKPNTAKGMVLIGHSAGSYVSANMANRWNWFGVWLPEPKGLVLVQAAADLSTYDTLYWVPAAIKIACIVGNQDNVVGRYGCDAVWDKTPSHVPAANRNYIWMYSDTHGNPDLIADHYAPLEGGNPINALDWYGFWKLADGMRDCGFFGTNCAYAIGNTTQQKNMGNWSDGIAVKKLTVTSVKPACPAGSQAAGC